MTAKRTDIVPSTAKSTPRAIARRFAAAGFVPVGRAWLRESDGVSVAPVRGSAPWAIYRPGAVLALDPAAMADKRTMYARTLSDASAYVATLTDGDA